MYEYTLEQCKKDFLQMWKWLYENPEKEKEDFIKAHPDYPWLSSECAACEYDSCVKDDCSSCPVDSWRHSGPSTYIPNRGCTKENSPYEKWDEARTVEDREIWAKEVYKLGLGIKV